MLGNFGLLEELLVSEVGLHSIDLSILQCKLMLYGVLIGFELLLQHEILRQRISVRCAFRIFEYQYRYT